MRIREIGKTLHLIRYAGYDKEGKKPVEAKIGSVGWNCSPIVLEHDEPTDPDQGIPKSLWRKLTIEEQEKLIEDLTHRRLKWKQMTFSICADEIKNCVREIDAITPELAAKMWESMAELQKALKKAGHPKPHLADKTPQKAASGPQDTKTIPMALDTPEKS